MTTNGMNEGQRITYPDVHYYTPTTAASSSYTIQTGADYIQDALNRITYRNDRELECNFPISEIRILAPGRAFTLKFGADTRHCVETKTEDFTKRLSLMTDDIRVLVDIDGVPFDQEEISLDEFLSEFARKE